MRFLLRFLLGLSLAVGMLFGKTQPNAPVLVPEAFNPRSVLCDQPASQCCVT